MKLTFLFWNLNRRPLLRQVAQLVREHSADIVVLAECQHSHFDVVTGINTMEGPTFSEPYNPNQHLRILTRFRAEYMIPIRDIGRVSVRSLELPLSASLLLVMAHFPSKLHMSPDDQAQYCTDLAQYIQEAEDKVGHFRTVIFGDLNMDPFDSGVVGAAGLHAVMSKRIAARKSRCGSRKGASVLL